ncbi:hypothetical protein MTR67_036105 [Solanum verrucosum]|uniref:Non-specific lipid-transfer protein n=1 Tax=Solanum verrucosum TaxID=315347 RepID=A0AAF0UBD7_SOLVR|nr:hypothetical protein MTR67_036105 [Solanum verrucosum]
MEEEDEVEGGEIYDDSHIDIDAKIQTVLGDYIKDFEGAVSAENLGPKFGVYGSFLPIDQLSSDLHTDSDKANCPELTTSGDKPPVAPSLYKEIRFAVLRYGFKQQSEAECGMMRKPVYKKAIGYGKVARPYIAFCKGQSTDAGSRKVVAEAWELLKRSLVERILCMIDPDMLNYARVSHYLMGGSNKAAAPAGCCSGIQSLYTAASTTTDRQGVCSCLKSGAASLGNSIDTSKAATLLSKCGVTVPYKISPDIDCSQVQ